MEKQRAKEMELAVHPVHSSLLCQAASESEVGAPSLQGSRGGCSLCDMAPINVPVPLILSDHFI